MVSIQQTIAMTCLLFGPVACAPEGTFDFPVSSSADETPWPEIQPRSAFPVDPSDTDDRIAVAVTDRDALAERAANLRNRAARLSSSSLITADERARLSETVGQ